MATYNPDDPDKRVHVLRRPRHKRNDEQETPAPAVNRTKQVLNYIISGIQICVCIYAFYLLAIVAGASPRIDYAGSGEIAIPGGRWFIYAAITGFVWWLTEKAKSHLR